ncbi:MAG: ABC transporter permease [Bryobacterales bacterium]|nr:ABC transporter permease [Bryobacterales bacterium]
MSLLSRLANALRPSRLNRDIDEELEAHIQDAIEAGRDPEEARRAFGSVLRHRESSRDLRLATWLEALLADLTFGWRQLNKHRAASLAAVLSLGLAIGACLAAFRLIDALLLRPLPVTNPQSLVYLTYPYIDNLATVQYDGEIFDYPQFRILKTAAQPYAELLAITGTSLNALSFGGEEDRERIHRQMLSGTTLGSFGIQPALGRLLTAADDQPNASPVAILSYEYWTRRFQRDPSILGRKFRYGTTLVEIVGVTQPGFTGTEPGAMTDIFAPTASNAKALDNPHWGWFRVWARLRDGVTPEQLRDALQPAFRANREQRIKNNPNDDAHRREQYLNAKLAVHTAASGVSDMQREYRIAMLVVGAVAALVLLIACANAASLMTARSVARAREMALRVSIGAGRARLVQLVLCEAFLVAVAASLVGALVAWQAAPMVVARLQPSGAPARFLLPLDARVAIFALALLVLVVLLFGCIPAVRASRTAPAAALRTGAQPARLGVLHALVAFQVALCFVIHLTTGLFTTTAQRLTTQPLGFQPQQVLAVEAVSRLGNKDRGWQPVIRQLAQLPGVESVGLSGWPLMSNNAWTSPVWVNGNALGSEECYVLFASPGFFETMRIALLQGRDFRISDDKASVIVNQAFARRYFDGANPVGQFVELPGDGKRERMAVTGLVADARYTGLREPIRPTVYLPIDSEGAGLDWGTYNIRTTAPDPMAVSSAVRNEIRRANPKLRAANVHRQTELVEQHSVRERLLALLSVFFAATALLMAALGLFGVLTYAVTQRRKEIGIRLALGSTAFAITRSVTASTGRMLLLGAIAGLGAGLLAQRYLESLLFETAATDPAVLAMPLLALLSGTLLACLPPVVRALRIDPATTLREE